MLHFKIACAGLVAALSSSVAMTSPGQDEKQLIAAKEEQVSITAQHPSLLEKQEAFEAIHPGAKIGTWRGQSSVYGKSFGSGATPIATAEAFRTRDLPVLGIPADELKPYASFLPHDNPGGNAVPLMYDPNTGTYKFTAVYYTQQRDGLEVYGSRMTLLTRNLPNNPLVLAKLAVRDLGAFQVDAAQLAQPNLTAALNNVRAVMGRNAAMTSQPRAVIWAGVDDEVVQPTVALVFNAEVGDMAMGNYQGYEFVCDAVAGTILHQESLIHDVDVSGTISGMATTGWGADICGGIAAMPMPYAKASIGGTSVFADANGNFTIPNAGSGSVSVQADLTGRYFDLRTCNGSQVPSPQGSACGGTVPPLTQSVTPPGPANFMFNAANTDALRRAEVNAYLQANVVRDYLLSYNPAFPTISTELGFDCNVNLGLTCNAFYSSSAQSINFYIAGGGCTNTSNTTVVHHEYGHRIVNAAGSGQGAYGEGFGDVMAVLISDQSCLGDGFNAPCGPPGGCLRNANNTCQYQTSGCSTCGSEAHDCGRLIAGCVWSTRNYLAAVYPATYRQILSSLMVNSVLLHTGSSITPQITLDVLTLDDDDANLANGTPHYNQINAGFTDHNMPGPAVTNAILLTPTTGPTHLGVVGGPYTNDPFNYTMENNTNASANFTASINPGGDAPLRINGLVPPVNGTLTAHQITNLSVSVDPAANSLPAGIYHSTVHVVDTTNNVQYDLLHTLEIGQIGWTTTPANGLISDGPVGGPFNATQVYTLTSTKPTPVTVRVAAGANWISLNGGPGPVDLVLNGIGSTANVTVGFSAAANSLPNGLVNSQVTFTNIGSGGSASDTSRPVSLDVGRFTYTAVDTPKTICDLCQNVTSSITVPDNYCVGDVDVQVDITHTFIGDLTVTLVNPQGVQVRLHNRTGGSTDNIHKLYSDQGPNTPDGPGTLSMFNGVSAAGVWQLRVSDHASGDTGSLDSWQLKIAAAGALCPPIASDVTVSVPVVVNSNITLTGTSTTIPNPNYVIMSMPSHGSLYDPNGGQITAGSLPYTLLGQGKIVRYKPDAAYGGPDSFTFRLFDGQNSNIANVNITVGGPQLVYSFPMDTDPGWTFTGPGTNGWAFGHPNGAGGDPSSGHTGTNVIGYNLNGAYTNSMPEYTCTSTAINCSNLAGVQVKFWRWLGVEQANFDHARLQVSTNGTTWTTVWENPAGTGQSIIESAWSQQTYALPTADHQATVYLRWTMGTTDTSVTYSGWNIDDVEIWGIRPPCAGDVNADSVVNVSDLLMVINAWGACNGCPADANQDGFVNVSDLLIVINGWGSCP